MPSTAPKSQIALLYCSSRFLGVMNLLLGVYKTAELESVLENGNAILF